MSDYALAKWSSIYHTNSKGNLSIDSKLKVGADIPKTIKVRIVTKSNSKLYLNYIMTFGKSTYLSKNK